MNPEPEITISTRKSHSKILKKQKTNEQFYFFFRYFSLHRLELIRASEKKKVLSIEKIILRFLNFNLNFLILTMRKENQKSNNIEFRWLLINYEMRIESMQVNTW